MASWTEFESEAPELAARVRVHLDAYTNKTLATVRASGAPRISASETEWRHGELWIGSMWHARKALDLQRDPRFALHAGTGEPPPEGDSKLAGIAEEITDPPTVAELNSKAPPGPSHLFRLDLREVSSLSVNAARTGIEIDVWTPGDGVRTIQRS